MDNRTSQRTTGLIESDESVISVLGWRDKVSEVAVFQCHRTLYPFLWTVYQHFLRNIERQSNNPTTIQGEI